MAEEKVFQNLRSQNTPAQIIQTTHYVYSNLPRSVPQDLKGRRPRYQNNVPKPQGVHHFYNMMWDPRVRRGVTYVTPADQRDAEGEKLRKKLMAPLPPREMTPWDSYSPEKRKEITAERHLPAQLRAKRHMALQIEMMNQLAEASRSRKRNRAKRRREREEAQERLDQLNKQKQLLTKRNSEGWPDDAEEETANIQDHLKELLQKEEEYIRKLSLVSADSDVELRDDEPSLVELELDDRPSDDSQDEDEVPRQAKWIFPAVPSLDPLTQSEKPTQTLPGDFFTLTEKYLGAMGHMVAAAIKGAITDLCLEEEQHTMEMSRAEFERKRLEHAENMRKLQIRTHVVIDERERLKAADEEEERLMAEGKKIVRRAMFSSHTSGDLVVDTLKALERDGFFGDLYLHRVNAEFIPWVMSAVKLYVRDETIARAILDELVKQVVATKDDELQYANYKQCRTTESGSFYVPEKESEHNYSGSDDFF